MSKTQKYLRMGYCGDVGQMECLWIIAIHWLMTTFACATICIVLMANNLFNVLSMIALFLLVLVLMSATTGLIYNDKRDHRYFFADFPLDKRCSCLMALSLVGIFPVLIYSYVQLRQQRELCRRSDKIASENLAAQHNLWRSRSTVERFPLELPTVLQCYSTQQWRLGYAQERSAKLQELDETLSKIDQYQKAVERFRTDTKAIQQWLDDHPEGATPSEDDLENLKNNLGVLATRPEVLAVTPDYGDGTNELQSLDIHLRICDSSCAPDNILGYYVLHLTPDWKDSTLELLMSGMTTNYHKRCKVCDLQPEPDFREFLRLPYVAAMMNNGDISKTVSALVNWLREHLIGGIDHGNLDRYFLPTEDRQEQPPTSRFER